MNTPGYQEALRRIENLEDDGILDLDKLGLTVLPPLPDTVRELYCGKNKLTSLPELPPHLVELACDKNQLTALPTLPDSLEALDCSINKITQLPNLPARLEFLDCNQNKLTSLPTLPNTLQTLNFAHNGVTRIPRLPDSLTEFDGKFNSFAEPFYLYHTRFSGSHDISRLRKDVNTYLDTFSKGRNVAALKGVAKSPQDTLASNVLTHPLYSGLVGQYMSGKESLSLTNQIAALKRNAGRGGSRRKTRKVRKGRKSRKSHKSRR